MNIYALAAGFFSGLFASMGLGGGSVLVIYLLFFENMAQTKAGGINLLFFIPIALVSVMIYAFKRQIKFKSLIKIIGGGVLGCFIGIFISTVFPNIILSKIFGLFLCILGVNEMVKSVKLYLKNNNSSDIMN